MKIINEFFSDIGVKEYPTYAKNKKDKRCRQFYVYKKHIGWTVANSIYNSIQKASSGLSASQAGLNVTGQNISNVNTEGYSRQGWN